jgi:hypothetical protein
VGVAFCQKRPVARTQALPGDVLRSQQGPAHTFFADFATLTPKWPLMPGSPCALLPSALPPLNPQPRSPHNQVASLQAEVAGLDDLRREHASLEAAAARGEGLAALNSELRLALLGADGAAEEHAQLSRAASEVEALIAQSGELRERLQDAEGVQVGSGSRQVLRLGQRFSAGGLPHRVVVMLLHACLTCSKPPYPVVSPPLRPTPRLPSQRRSTKGCWSRCRSWSSCGQRMPTWRR